jgi:hypothetical protein
MYALAHGFNMSGKFLLGGYLGKIFYFLGLKFAYQVIYKLFIIVIFLPQHSQSCQIQINVLLFPILYVML